MKKKISFKLLLFIMGIALLFGFSIKQNKSDKSNDYKYSFKVTATNNTKLERKDVVISINLKKIKEKYSQFNYKDFFVSSGKIEVPSQFIPASGEGSQSKILFITSFNPNEKKDFVIHYSKNGNIKRHYKQRAQAVLGIKTDYKKIKGYYTGGRFVDIDSTVVPKDHFAHDALYRIEGPSWESDLIAYRFYLDSRNRNDITGKKTHEMVLQKMGVHDLISNSAESYTKMLPWGMDIFKVGESLGIGSIAMWYDNKVNTLSKLEKEECKINADGPIQADVLTKYLGWKVGNEKFNLISNLSINAGSRLTKVKLNIKGKKSILCTGFAKHENCKFIKSNDKKIKWGYIGLYGKQSLAGDNDNLGIVLFYKLKDLDKITEDSLSHIVVLNPMNGRLVYYFAAAWDKEPGGIKNINEFKVYLNNTIKTLSEPIKISF